ncbi:hypothetical protein [Staphylococcus hominis]|uniref:Uncharacterized protein n=1 Tax=Staphylococcus hominis TaxID=1290 RepID=A0A8X8GTV4_STAHO|nr:hypothetical protein [Staphylococcus hominis]MCM5673023.1 hypothetical protein [Staphylococcus hominis]
MNKKHEFVCYGHKFKLVESVDCFGCSGVCVYMDSQYYGILDTSDATDFYLIESRIKADPDYIYSMDVYC